MVQLEIRRAAVVVMPNVLDDQALSAEFINATPADDKAGTTMQTGWVCKGYGIEGIQLQYCGGCGRGGDCDGSYASAAAK